MDFERVEDLHDLAAGMEYDAYRERISALREDTTDEEEAKFREEFGYAENDPKHPSYHDRYADVWDAREGK